MFDYGYGYYLYHYRMYQSEPAIIFLREFSDICCHHKLSAFWHADAISQWKDAKTCQKQFYMTGKFVKNITAI